MASSASSEAQTVIKVTDAHLNDLYSNHALAELSGYDPSELERRGWVTVLDPQARSLVEEIVQSVGRMPYLRECFDTNIICRDGSTRTLAWEVVALTPEQFPVMLITARESKQKPMPGAASVRTREVPSIPNRLWAEIFDSLPECVSIHDENFTIIAANKALCERLGVKRSEIVGRKCHEVFHGADHAPEDCVLVRALATQPGSRVCREALEPAFEGVCRAEASALTIDRSGLRGVVHTMRSVDGYAADTSDSSRRQLDGLSHLANAVAHDYNNLLSGVVGYGGMLETLPDLPAKAQRYVEELVKATERLNEMTQRLLLFGRRRGLHSQQVDLNRLVEGTLQSPDWTPAGRTIHFEGSDSPVEVLVDPGQIQVVIQNLVANALQAVNETGGVVVVRTAWRQSTKALSTFFGPAPAGKYGAIEVRDTGPGIPPERLARIFEPFAGSEHRPPGHGLGLAIVYRIVQNHNGFLEAESELGIGTHFTILLPVSR